MSRPHEYARTTLNARPSTAKAHFVPPDPDLEPPNLYRFVLRRRDRFPDQVQRVPVSYTRGNALSRDITTPWDGVRAATLFLRDEKEVLAARGYGWLEDITERWFAHLRGEDVSVDDPEAHPPAPDPEDSYPDFSVTNDDLEAEEDQGGAEEGGEAPIASEPSEASAAPEPSVEYAEAGDALSSADQLTGAAYRQLQRWAKATGISPKQSGAKLRKALKARLAEG